MLLMFEVLCQVCLPWRLFPSFLKDVRWNERMVGHVRTEEGASNAVELDKSASWLSYGECTAWRYTMSARIRSSPNQFSEGISSNFYFLVIYSFKSITLVCMCSVLPAYCGRFPPGQTGSLTGSLYPARSSGWSVPTDEWLHQHWWCWLLPALRFVHGSRLHHLHSLSQSPLSAPIRMNAQRLFNHKHHLGDKKKKGKQTNIHYR